MKSGKRLWDKDSKRFVVIGIALLLGILVVIVWFPGCRQPSDGIVVNFPDSALDAAIRDAIGKPKGDIHDHDLTRLWSLYAVDQGIASLEGIQYCTNLISLFLSKNQIVDISALANLTNVEVLYLDNNQIADIGAFAEDYRPIYLEAEPVDKVHWVDLTYNYLDLSSGSPDMLDIDALQGRGVIVGFDPQN